MKVINILIQTRKVNKSCESCKFRQFDQLGWYCLKNDKWFNDYYAYEIDKELCKYYKRDVNYCLSNGYYKYQERNKECYYYKKGKFVEVPRL